MQYLDELKARAGYRSDLSVATKAGISHTAIGGWRRGTQRPSMDSLRKLAEVLGADPRELWVRAGLAEPESVGLAEWPDPTEDDIVQLVRRSELPDADKEAIIEEIRRQEAADRDRRRSWVLNVLHFRRT